MAENFTLLSIATLYYYYTQQYLLCQGFCFGEFYKAEWYGRKIAVINRFYPSSQMCSVCGVLWSGTKDLTVREWICPDCGAVHNRDINAAKNILAEGLRVLA